MLDGTHVSTDGLPAHAAPGESADVQVWILGASGGSSAAVAGASVDAVVAETDEQATELASGYAPGVRSIRRGEGAIPDPAPAVAHGIYARGETPFLHAAADNTNANELYKHLGFRLRTDITFTVVRIPGL
ncbi:GNAT family N-acetyltransferase [Williamsia sp.]|uniref:GNAT family N-acetyltransferase n=1 Tax=Williamsia sp. TaxID=1872085 RepID=UPI002F932BA6